MVIHYGAWKNDGSFWNGQIRCRGVPKRPLTMAAKHAERRGAVKVQIVVVF